MWWCSLRHQGGSPQHYISCGRQREQEVLSSLPCQDSSSPHICLCCSLLHFCDLFPCLPGFVFHGKGERVRTFFPALPKKPQEVSQLKPVCKSPGQCAWALKCHCLSTCKSILKTKCYKIGISPYCSFGETPVPLRLKGIV